MSEKRSPSPAVRAVGPEGADTTNVLPEGSVDPVYQAKAKVLNDAIQTIGMGKYQVITFTVF
jgi:hypothetical protein